VTPAFTDIEVGDELPAQSFPITRADLVRYCGASGDFNVIHWNERVATSVGLPNVIAHGMFTMAEAVRVVTDWLGDPGALLDYGCRFTRPDLVPDDDNGATLTVSAKITEKRDDNTVVITISASCDDSTVLGKAQAVVRLP
jgi:acyl dehydratase